VPKTDRTNGSSSTQEHPNTSTTVVNYHMKIYLDKEEDQPVKTSEGSPSAKSVYQATCARECHTQMNRRRYCVVRFKLGECDSVLPIEEGINIRLCLLLGIELGSCEGFG
jgi:hypothetical protein